jgi:DNA-binding GntR family transcriptional regulator
VTHLPAGSTAFTVVTGIRRAIQRGDLRPGDLLPDEESLSFAFGINRRLLHRGLLILADAGQATRHGSTGWQLAF